MTFKNTLQSRYAALGYLLNMNLGSQFLRLTWKSSFSKILQFANEFFTSMSATSTFDFELSFVYIHHGCLMSSVPRSEMA